MLKFFIFVQLFTTTLEKEHAAVAIDPICYKKLNQRHGYIWMNTYRVVSFNVKIYFFTYKDI
jgi:hypothetical protein